MQTAQLHLVRFWFHPTGPELHPEINFISDYVLFASNLQ